MSVAVVGVAVVVVAVIVAAVIVAAVVVVVGAAAEAAAAATFRFIRPAARAQRPPPQEDGWRLSQARCPTS